jgi:hypothetical protein
MAMGLELRIERSQHHFLFQSPFGDRLLGLPLSIGYLEKGMRYARTAVGRANSGAPGDPQVFGYRPLGGAVFQQRAGQDDFGQLRGDCTFPLSRLLSFSRGMAF